MYESFKMNGTKHYFARLLGTTRLGLVCTMEWKLLSLSETHPFGDPISGQTVMCQTLEKNIYIYIIK